MARLAAAAVAQFDALPDHYMERGRDEAIRRLRVSVGEALATIDANPMAGRPFPGAYRSLARWGFLWIKIHRYWFGYTVSNGDAVVTNILYETSDIPRRLVPRQGDG